MAGRQAVTREEICVPRFKNRRPNSGAPPLLRCLTCSRCLTWKATVAARRGPGDRPRTAGRSRRLTRHDVRPARGDPLPDLRRRTISGVCASRSPSARSSPRSSSPPSPRRTTRSWSSASPGSTAPSAPTSAPTRASGSRAALPLRDTELVVAKGGDVEACVSRRSRRTPTSSTPSRRSPSPRPRSDTYFANQWGLNNTGQTLRRRRHGGRRHRRAGGVGVTRGAGRAVAVVDTGVDSRTPTSPASSWSNPGETAAAGRQRRRRRRQRPRRRLARLGLRQRRRRPRRRSNGHGTHVAGTIARGDRQRRRRRRRRAGREGAAGQVLGGPGTAATSSAIAAGVRLRGLARGRVVNASLGGLGRRSRHRRDARAPEHALRRRGGQRRARRGDYFPCNSPAANVVCVGASDQLDAPADFSNIERDLGRPLRPRRYVLRPR